MGAEVAGSGRNRFGWKWEGGAAAVLGRLVEVTKLSCIPRNINGNVHFVTTMRRRLKMHHFHTDRAFILLRNLP